MASVARIRRDRAVGVAVIYDSPVGPLLIETDDEGRLTQIEFGVVPASGRPSQAGETPAPHDDVIRQLREYFTGKRKTFDVKLAPQGTTFQQDVWAALREIPYGETRSYRDIARMLGRPNATRAVGAANGANPIPIIIPCHRVIGANGALTGFGGGLAMKRHLLDLESPPLFRNLASTLDVVHDKN